MSEPKSFPMHDGDCFFVPREAAHGELIEFVRDVDGDVVCHLDSGTAFYIAAASVGAVVASLDALTGGGYRREGLEDVKREALEEMKRLAAPPVVITGSYTGNGEDVLPEEAQAAHRAIFGGESE